jgi:hypothetical protein
MKLKNKYCLFPLALLLLIMGQTACYQSEASFTPYEEINIDYRAVFKEEFRTEEQVQVLLRISLENYDGDLLKYGINEPEKHQERLNYYITDFKNDIKLLSNGDTLSCLDSHFERLQMDSPYRNFILTFNTKTKPQELLIEDRVFANQLIKLTIDHE